MKKIHTLDTMNKEKLKTLSKGTIVLVKGGVRGKIHNKIGDEWVELIFTQSVGNEEVIVRKETYHYTEINDLT